MRGIYAVRRVNVLPRSRLACRWHLPSMEGSVFRPFPRAPMPLKLQLAQRGGRAIISSLVVSLFLFFVVPPSRSLALVPTQENFREEGMVAAPANARLPQSSLGNALTVAEGVDGTPSAPYRSTPLSPAAFGFGTLPTMVLTNTMPAYSPETTATQAFSSYSTLGMNSLPREASATQAMQHGGGDEREDIRNQEGAGDIPDAALQHQKPYVGDPHDRVGAAPLQAMTLVPRGAMWPLNPSLTLLRVDPRGSSAAVMSQHTFGKLQDDSGFWHARYSLSPLQATMHSGLLHAHVNPALCCRHGKYGIYAANPWYCSLVCRLMARRVAEKEAARRMAERQTLRASPGPRTLPGAAEWFSTEEYRRLTKAVLDASRRSPVVVFTKGHCRYCKDAIKLLQDIGVKKIYVVDLGRAPDMLKLQLVLEELTGARTVPRIYIGGVCIGGLSDMTREHESGALRERLQRAAAL